MASPYEAAPGPGPRGGRVRRPFLQIIPDLTREDPWTAEEMLDVMWRVCQKSVPYYEERYGPLKKGPTQVTMLTSTE